MFSFILKKSTKATNFLLERICVSKLFYQQTIEKLSYSDHHRWLDLDLEPWNKHRVGHQKFLSLFSKFYLWKFECKPALMVIIFATLHRTMQYLKYMKPHFGSVSSNNKVFLDFKVLFWRKFSFHLLNMVDTIFTKNWWFHIL